MNRCLLLSHLAALSVILSTVPSSLCAAGPVYEQQENVVYGEVHGTGLLMDIFTPTGAPNGLAIVDVVSGAWYSDRGKIRDHKIALVYDIFCARGYVVFAARPGSKTRYTLAEMDQHVKRAIRYVKENSAQHKIDPQRIGIMGASAGGHLATLAALTPLTAVADAKDPLERHATAVKAVGVFFPPTDFLDWKDGQLAPRELLGPLVFLGGGDARTEQELRDAARAVSPLYHVDKPTVPFLLIHGDADPLVPLAQSEKLTAAIKQAGGSATLIVKRGGGHPWLTLPVEVAVMADWFDKQLRL